MQHKKAPYECRPEGSKAFWKSIWRKPLQASRQSSLSLLWLNAGICQLGKAAFLASILKRLRDQKGTSLGDDVQHHSLAGQTYN